MDERNKKQLGKLRIFLGAAPGVGKTYTMLEEAIRKKKEGVNVIIGIIETHGRSMIDELSKNIDAIPRKKILYKNRILEEFDLNAAISRHPEIILVDELAHTNIGNNEHDKRWQDVIRLIYNGIDVYTTLNVQHIESLNELVAQITGVVVRETLPDSVLEQADAIELIDIPTEDLLERLETGNIYKKEQIEFARRNFFSMDKLISLRELALRITADRAIIQKYQKVDDKILVCIGNSYSCTKMLRMAKRISKNMNDAEILAIYCDNESYFSLSKRRKDMLLSNIGYAEGLGIETYVIAGYNISETILDFASDNKFNKIVIGRAKKKLQKKIFKWRNVFDSIIRYYGNFDLIIVNLDKKYYGVDSHSNYAVNDVRDKKTIGTYYNRLKFAFLVIFVATLLNYVMVELDEITSFLIYIIGIILIASETDKITSIMSSILSVILFESLFTISDSRLYIELDWQLFFTVCIVVAISLISNHIIEYTKKQSMILKSREKKIRSLYELNKIFIESESNDLIYKIESHLSNVFCCKATVMLRKDIYDIKQEEKENHKEINVAKWSYEMGKVAGRFTKTLVSTESTYFPLVGTKSKVGVIRILLLNENDILMPEQINLIDIFSNQISIAIENRLM